jgi:hypothetical protein
LYFGQSKKKSIPARVEQQSLILLQGITPQEANWMELFLEEFSIMDFNH